MGSNSTEALEAFMEDYLSRCSVVGGEIITPGRKKKAQEEFDPEAGGHRLLPVGRPDQKRGQ